MPHSSKGKNRFRKNAFKHGLTATDEILVSSLSPLERERYKKIHRSTHSLYKPKTPAEKEIVNRISILKFRRSRLYALESIATQDCMDNPLEPKSILPHLDRFSRYDWRISRDLRELHNTLYSHFISRGDHSLKPLYSKG